MSPNKAAMVSDMMVSSLLLFYSWNSVELKQSSRIVIQVWCCAQLMSWRTTNQPWATPKTCTHITHCPGVSLVTQLYPSFIPKSWPLYHVQSQSALCIRETGLKRNGVLKWRHRPSYWTLRSHDVAVVTWLSVVAACSRRAHDASEGKL